MNRKTAVIAALLGLLIGVSGIASANPTNDMDALVLTVTPNADYGVDISTTAAEMNLGAVNLYESTFTVHPATVTFLGNKSGQELDLSASVGSAWKFDVSPSTWSTSGEQNALSVYALFSATTLIDAPTGDDFAAGAAAAGFNVDAQSLGPVRVGGAGGAGAKYEKQGADSMDMDSKNPNDQAHLWFLLRLPNETTTESAQDVRVTLTATITNL